MADKTFADGMSFKLPPENAPEWLKGKIAIRVDTFLEFIDKHGEAGGWINIDVKESRGGKLYCELNTYKRA